MHLEPAPRLPKWIFLAIDGVLLLIAFAIVYLVERPFTPVYFVSVVCCVVLAAIIGLIPFLIDYAADSAEYVQQERERVSEQVQRLHAAGESLARAAAQIKAVEEAVHKAAHTAENLPYRMQEKLAEFNEALAEKDNDEREALERELDELRAASSDQLKGVADKIGKATTDWAALEVAARKQFAATQEAAAKLDERLRATLAQIDARIAALHQAAAAVPSVIREIVRETAPPQPAHAVPEPEAVTPVAAAETAVIESVTLSESAPPLEESKPRKPRAPRKPKPEETLAAMSAPAPAAEAASPADAPAESAEESAPSSAGESAAASPPSESAASSDGATRLLATAYIGIGNKLFIRGEGPGLSWDKGVPMQFVSIGKWGWASHDVTAPVRAKLYKNDETAALSGEITLEPGKHVEVTALF